MLLELEIKNIALIESLRIEFTQGFNVLTGETGAGKSIIVDSMNLVLGGRADRDMIKNGTDKGSVQALFDISQNDAALKMAAEMDLDIDDGIIAVAREISRTGRNICRIAGCILPLNQLKAFTALLMDIHGQHEHQALMNPGMHMEFLDAFGGSEHGELIRMTSEAYKRRSDIARALKKTMHDTAERERLVDVLSFQIKEIGDARLKTGEEEKLQKKLRTLENIEKIKNAVDTAYGYTYTGMNGSVSAQEALRLAAHSMESIASIDSRYEKMQKTLQSLFYSVQEAGYDLQAMSSEAASDPELIDKINSRLDRISKLERKYGSTIDEILSYYDECKTRLEAIEDSEGSIEELKKRLKIEDRELNSICEKLSESRKSLAQQLEKRLLEQLADLGMAKARFRVDFKRREKPTATGVEDIEFMISTNPGEPLKPLAATASGGELSRIMLALKTIALNNGGIDSMVFDEIDTGVSGRMAQVVGEKMCAISAKKQVLCVTHLPQIAALGSSHYKVEKTSDEESTRTSVRFLDQEGRILELSRLVGGANDNESSLTHAANMLRDAKAIREALIQ